MKRQLALRAVSVDSWLVVFYSSPVFLGVQSSIGLALRYWYMTMNNINYHTDNLCPIGNLNRINRRQAQMSNCLATLKCVELNLINNTRPIREIPCFYSLLYADCECVSGNNGRFACLESLRIFPCKSLKMAHRFSARGFSD